MQNHAFLLRMVTKNEVQWKLVVFVRGFVRTPDLRHGAAFPFQIADSQVGQEKRCCRTIHHWEREKPLPKSICKVSATSGPTSGYRALYPPESHRLTQLSKEINCETTRKKYERSHCCGEGGCCFPEKPHWGPSPNLHARLLLKHTSKTIPQELHFQVTSVPKASFQMNDGHLFSSIASFFGSQRWFICQQLRSVAPGNFCQLKPFNETQRTRYQFNEEKKKA